MLLAGAGLLVRSWWHVSRVDPGFTPGRVLVMDVAAPASFNGQQRTDLFQRALEQIQAVPGVESAGITDDLFSSNPREHVLTFERNGGTISERFRLLRDEVSADFFRAMGTPLLHGRAFSRDDRPEAPPAAIVNEALARRAWPGGDAIGRRFMIGAREASGPWFTVVGVVADMRRQGPEREALPQIFVALAQNPASRNVGFFVRTSSDDPLTMAAAVRAAVRRVEPNAAIAGVATLEQQLGSYLTQRRFQTVLLGGFAAVALLMAAIGIYGLVQYSIVTRTREIGLRMAIGARPGDIFRMIVGEGLTLSLAGAGIGLIGALWLGRAGAGLLFGVTATDPLTFAAVSTLLTAVAVAACYFPARRAMKVDPIRALRTA